MASTRRKHRWDAPDMDALRILAEMPFERRLLSMLHAQRVLLDTIRGQLSIVYPDMDTKELNLRVLEEIQRRQERTDRVRTRRAQSANSTTS